MFLLETHALIQLSKGPADPSKDGSVQSYDKWPWMGEPKESENWLSIHY